jgi:hypothetical protein
MEKRMVGLLVMGMVGAWFFASTTAADITYGYSDEFPKTRYDDWADIPAATSSWDSAAAFLHATADSRAHDLNPNDNGLNSGGEGGVRISSGANGQLAMLYADQTLGVNTGYKVSVDMEALPFSKKGGLVVHWNSLDDQDSGFSAYAFQLYARTNGAANHAVRFIKYANAADAGNGQAPSPSTTLLDYTNLTGFSALPVDVHSQGNVITLSVEYDGSTNFSLRAVQGANSWSKTVSDPGTLITGGYAGMAVQRGNGLDEGDNNNSAMRVDNFEIIPEPTTVTVSLLGLALILLRRKLYR